MNKFKEIIKTNKRDGFETTFPMDKEYFDMDRLDCFWYDAGFPIANIENDEFRIEAKVFGEIRYALLTKTGDIITIEKDPNKLGEYDILNDTDLHTLIEGNNPDYNFSIIDHNWIEMPIFDKATENYITDEYDSTCITPDTNDVLECIDGGVADYLNGFLCKDEEITLE